MGEVRAIFSDISADGQRIERIIDGVRKMFSESSHDRQALNLNTVVQDVLSTAKLDLQLHRVDVETRLESDLPLVLADSGLLHQVFQNLITNALEAMTDVAGRRRVLTVTSRIAGGASEIVVTVDDTGTGIADKYRDSIFEPFFSTKAAGSGIGLTICQSIIKAHGGRLEVHAKPLYGTSFRVILPGRVDA